jgi:hypothetical protein
MRIKNFQTLLVLAFLLPTLTFAKVGAKEAKKLDSSLTPMGAQRSGNKSGSIPKWTGGIKKAPAGYKAGGYYVDPFASDKPKFTINASNMDKYKANLTPGQIALMKKYPKTFSMNVYKTRRSASFSDAVYSAIKKNASSAVLTSGGNGVENAIKSSPFPIPQSGVEVIWNHLMRYRGNTIERLYAQIAPTAGGRYTTVKIDENILLAYGQPGATIKSINNRLGYFLQKVVSPARLSGAVLLVHETLNQAEEPREAWVYNPGQRRVRRAPNVAFDNPGTASDGQRTSDQLDMFNGSPERYNWELVGKKEIYIPYNSYKLHQPSLKYKDIAKKGHLNPDHLRYELHRVWVVDATLKKGTSHIYKRRTFYLDEDSWQAAVVDQYDNRDKIWRVSEAYIMNYYDQPLVWDTGHAHYDLQNGRYLAFGFYNEDRPYKFSNRLTKASFTPSALRRKGTR